MFISSRIIDFTEYENPQAIVRYYSVVYGVKHQDLFRTIECESNFRHEGLFGDNGRAYGIAQFHASTFKQFCEGDYKNMQDQIQCMARMFSEKLQRHWSCYTN